jgi:hypothetical protein
MTVIEEKGPISGVGIWIGVLVLILIFISGFWWFQTGKQAPISIVAPEEVTPAPTEGKTLKVSLANLKPLDSGYFELWATVEGEEISAGKFTTDGKGGLFDLNKIEIAQGEFTAAWDLGKTDKIFITIEPEEDENEAPSKTVLLEGKIKDGQADLTFSAVNLSTVSGQYFLGTPSFSQDKELASGVWFAKPAGREFTEQEASLDLLDAPSGWKYEGWVVYKDEFLTVGRFIKPVRDDEFKGYLGLHRYPDFPGEDFLINEPQGLDFAFPIELDDGESKVVVSLEPDIDGEDPTGNRPFQLQFLNAEVEEDVEIYTLYDLQRDLSSFPTGTAEIR